MQWIAGLVSISFRPLSPEKIIEIAKAAGLSAIEWGGDVHVPFGEIETAQRVGEMTRSAGLSIPEYDSYYRVGLADHEDFTKAAATARTLGTDCIRVWAYNKNPDEIDEDTYAVIVADAKRMCEEAPDLTICLECHNNTLTSNYKSALKFLQDVNCENFKMFWQPNQLLSHDENLEACRALLPYIQRVHTFSWEGKEKYPLAQHTDRWQEYMDILKDSTNATMPLMLEFMHDNNPDTLPETARTLLDWIK